MVFDQNGVEEIAPGTDIVEYDWFDVDNLPENCAPNIKPVIESCKQIKSNLRSF